MSMLGGTLLIDDQHLGNFQPAGQLGRDRRALKVLAVGPHHQDQLVGDGDRQQRLFVDAGMRVDEQVVELEVVDQPLEAVVELGDVVAFA